MPSNITFRGLTEYLAVYFRNFCLRPSTSLISQKTNARLSSILGNRSRTRKGILARYSDCCRPLSMNLERRSCTNYSIFFLGVSQLPVDSTVLACGYHRPGSPICFATCHPTLNFRRHQKCCRIERSVLPKVMQGAPSNRSNAKTLLLKFQDRLVCSLSIIEPNEYRAPFEGASKAKEELEHGLQH